MRDGVAESSSAIPTLPGLAVETVELKHPELVGGLGIYASRRNSKPYVHIDARGKKARLRG